MVLTATFWVLYGLYAALVVGVVVVILSQNRNPVKSLAWVTVLLLLPMVGLVLYFFFGQSLKNTRMMSRRNKRRLLNADAFKDKPWSLSSLPLEHKHQVRLINALDHAHYYPAGEMKLYSKGSECLTDIMADIEKAQHYVNVQFYIVMDDELGHKFTDLLIRKAQQGVKVRLIYDYVGSYGTKKRFFKKLNRAGVEAHAFFRVIFPQFATRINWRNHRKAVIIDGKVAYVGSMNIADRYVTGGDFDVWRDTAIRLTGAPVAGVQRNFAIDWSFMGQPLLIEGQPDQGESETPEAQVADSEGIQLITSGPTGRWSNIAFAYFRAITGAKRRVYIQTPYFLPTEGLLKALQVAALGGVDVRVMLPRRSDSWLLTYASQSYLTECLQAGVKFYLFDGMLHSKVIIVDNDFATLGSANFDFRSFEHNFEENVVVYSTRINEELTAQFFADMKRSQRVRLASWRRRPKMRKAKESILRLLSPLL